MNTEKKDICVVGCGRWLGGDDQVGLRVVEFLLQESGIPNARFVLTESPATDILDCLADASLLIVIDAAKPSRTQQTAPFARLDYWRNRDRIRCRAERDTHALSVDLALSVADELGLLPPEVWIYAVPVPIPELDDEMTESVAALIPQLALTIQSDVKHWQREREHELCYA